MKRRLKIAGFVMLLVVGFFGIPLIFCAIFHSDERSIGLGFIPSDLSASDWFSFWVALLTALGSISIAALALLLTLAIERRSSEDKHNKQKLSFVPVKILLKPGNILDSYMFVINLQQEVMLLGNSHCKVFEVEYNNQSFKINVVEHLDDWNPYFTLQCDEDDRLKFNASIYKWQQRSFAIDIPSEKFSFKLGFRYDDTDYRGQTHTYYLCMVFHLSYINDDNIIVSSPMVKYVSSIQWDSEGSFE